MSAFLGHIHYWLYHKIRRVIEREHLLYDKAEAMCGSTAEELRSQVWQSYGQPLVDVDLIDVIDQSNIHGWLQRQINIAESREAAFIKELGDTCSSAGIELAEAAFAEHGELCGKQAGGQGKYSTDSAKGIYQALQDYYLNGMPCDQVDTVIVNTEDEVVWEGGECLQAVNWKRAGVKAAIMKGCYRKWLSGFVTALNSGFIYTQTADTMKGDRLDRHKIAKA
ncbi:hypothetical protein HSX37_08690|uniref:Uncharacterized protein n=1 Tax=Dendrosporobacter quercicolus TaxID=146817 RepID=A0A1G9Q362_9FIRM|nr:hypothetical protein [Dendrosporobacter quercicolus]NSL48103.1 hypothetical protein [Dendrosporobacter quercicolus DSM 1736]SDM05429.1 hypothetical protein SAMN04488502_10227 [Dendrosporobacter quercicolus]